ncbi:MAG: OsmC family protein [Promethearchaeota archaeon]
MGDYKVECKMVERYQTVVGDRRGHMVVCDLPPEKGGYDQATSAVELAAMALADCIVTIYLVKAMGAKVKIEKCEMKGTASMPEGAPTITAFKGQMTVVSPAEKDVLDGLLEETLKVCPVGLIFKQAGVSVEVKLRKK